MRSDLRPRLQLRAEEAQLLKGPLGSLAKTTAHSLKRKSSRWPIRDVQNLLDTSSIFQPFWTQQIFKPVILYCSGLHWGFKFLSCKLLNLLALVFRPVESVSVLILDYYSFVLPTSSLRLPFLPQRPSAYLPARLPDALLWIFAYSFLTNCKHKERDRLKENEKLPHADTHTVWRLCEY